jgi:hypothetical protein
VLHGGARGMAANAAGIHRNHAGDQALPAPTPGAGGSLTGAAAYVFELDAGAWVQRAACSSTDNTLSAAHLHHGAAPQGPAKRARCSGLSIRCIAERRCGMGRAMPQSTHAPHYS